MTRLVRFLAAGLMLSAAPLTVHAGAALGGSVGSARVNEGQFQGNDTSYKIFFGSSYREIIGGELGYENFGQLGGNGPDAKAWSGAVTLGIPLDAFTPYAKGGVAWEDVGGNNSGAVTTSYKQNKPFYGLGLRFGATSSLGLRIEYERFQFRDQRLDMASAGLEFRF